MNLFVIGLILGACGLLAFVWIVSAIKDRAEEKERRRKDAEFKEEMHGNDHRMIWDKIHRIEGKLVEAATDHHRIDRLYGFINEHFEQGNPDVVWPPVDIWVNDYGPGYPRNESSAWSLQDYHSDGGVSVRVHDILTDNPYCPDFVRDNLREAFQATKKQCAYCGRTYNTDECPGCGSTKRESDEDMRKKFNIPYAVWSDRH